MIDKDEFDQWKTSTVTQWVLEGVASAADDKRDEFLSRFFFGSERNDYDLAYLRGEFFALLRLTQSELTYEDVVNMHESGELTHDLNGTWMPRVGGQQ